VLFRSDATIIIRADASTPTGIVQELIQICQQVRFEKFALRAKEEVSY
jgi:biopolymer transport protein ExbD